MKKKNYVGFHIPKIWQILKHFSGVFHKLPISEECGAQAAMQEVENISVLILSYVY